MCYQSVPLPQYSILNTKLTDTRITDQMPGLKMKL